MLSDLQQQQQKRLASIGLCVSEPSSSPVPTAIVRVVASPSSPSAPQPQQQQGPATLQLLVHHHHRRTAAAAAADMDTTMYTRPTTTSSLQHNQLLQQFETYFEIFDDYEVIDMSSVREQVLPAMQIGCDNNGMCPHVSLSSLEAHARQGNVDYVNLNLPSLFNHNDDEDDDRILLFRLYWDNSARLKQRPRNAQATAWLNMRTTTTTNNEEPLSTKLRQDDDDDNVIYGDAFLARYEDDEDQKETVTMLNRRKL